MNRLHAYKYEGFTGKHDPRYPINHQRDKTADKNRRERLICLDSLVWPVSRLLTRTRLHRDDQRVFMLLFNELSILTCCILRLLTHDRWNNTKSSWKSPANRDKKRLHLQAEDIFSISKVFLLGWTRAAAAAAAFFRWSLFLMVSSFTLTNIANPAVTLRKKTSAARTLKTKKLSWVVHTRVCQWTKMNPNIYSAVWLKKNNNKVVWCHTAREK